VADNALVRKWWWLAGGLVALAVTVLLTLKLTERQGPFDFLDGLEPMVQEPDKPAPPDKAETYTYWYNVRADYTALVAKAKDELIPLGWTFRRDSENECSFKRPYSRVFKTGPSSTMGIDTQEAVHLISGLRMVKWKRYPAVVEEKGWVSVFIYLQNHPQEDSWWVRLLKLLKLAAIAPHSGKIVGTYPSVHREPAVV
jgi:hypothetical protein